MRVLVIGLIAAGLLVPCLTFAEVSNSEIKALEDKIKALTDEVEKLKQARGKDEEKIDAVVEDVEKLRVFELVPELGKEGKYGFGPAASKVYGVERGLSIAGYGEVIGRFFDANEEFNLSSGSGSKTLRDDTDMQRLIMYLGYKFNDNILFNSEIEFEHAKTSSGPDTSAGEVSVEFANLDFLINPKFNLRGGLLLMPMGLINEFHESPTYHGVFKPDTEQFIIPTTWRENGVGIFGEVFPGWDYRLYVTPGLVTNSTNTSGASTAKFTHDSGIRGGRQQGVRSIAEDFAYTARLDYKGLPGFLAGTSIYTGKATTPAGNSLPATSTDITLWDVHLKAEYRGLEVRGLYAMGDINGAEGINQRANIGTTSGKSIGEELFGYYAEAAYDIVPLLFSESTQYFAPFIRYETYDTQDGVPSGYTDLPETERDVTTLGISYKPIPNVNIKADYQFRDGYADNFDIGLAFMF